MARNILKRWGVVGDVDRNKSNMAANILKKLTLFCSTSDSKLPRSQSTRHSDTSLSKVGRRQVEGEKG
jgi:hypothetical protein